MIKDKSSKSQHQHVPAQKLSTRPRKKWELQQTIKYCEFVKKNRLTLQYTQKKQKQRIYNRMASYIGTRTTHQCRSHHQKIIKRFGSIEGFIQNFTQKINSARSFMDWSESQLEGLESLRKLEKAKKLEYLQIKRPMKQQSPRNQYRLFPKFKTNQVPEIQLKPDFSNIDPCKYQQPPDRVPYLGHGVTYPRLKPLGFKQYSQNNNILINRGQDHHVHKQDINFYVPSSFNDNFNDRIIPEHDLNVWSNRWQNNEYSKDSQIHHHPLKMEKSQLRQKDRFRRPNWKSQSLSLNDLESPRFNYRKLTNFNFDNEHFPSYEKLKEKPQQMIDNAEFICSSILCQQNLNVINPLVRESQIELTNETIKIHGKQEANYQFWVQCPKMEQELSEVSEDENSDSEEIQRELVEEMVVKALMKLVKPSQLVELFKTNHNLNPLPEFSPNLNESQMPIKVVQTNIESKESLSLDVDSRNPENQEKSKYTHPEPIQQRLSESDISEEDNPSVNIENENEGKMPEKMTQEVKNSKNYHPCFIQSNPFANWNVFPPLQLCNFNPDTKFGSDFNPDENYQFSFKKPMPQHQPKYDLFEEFKKKNMQKYNKLPGEWLKEASKTDGQEILYQLSKEDMQIYNKRTGEGFTGTEDKKIP